MQLGVDISNLLGYVEKLEEGAAELGFDAEQNRLLLHGGGLSYKISPLATDSLRKPPKIPSLNDGYYDVELTGAQLKKCFDVASSVSDLVRFSIEGGVFCAAGEGDSDTARYEIPGISGPDTKAMFSEGLLAEVVPVLKVLPKVRLSLRTDYPVRLLFTLAEGVEGMYILAPRVSD